MNEPQIQPREAGAERSSAVLEISAADVESALAGHPQVAEVVVVPVALRLGHQVFSAFVTLTYGTAETDRLRVELAQRVRDDVGANAILEKVYFASNLPKTRSGKIMRDILQEMAVT
jgi:acetyl-CoA synthetase